MARRAVRGYYHKDQSKFISRYREQTYHTGSVELTDGKGGEFGNEDLVGVILLSSELLGFLVCSGEGFFVLGLVHLHQGLGGSGGGALGCGVLGRGRHVVDCG
jgi:hypothetical protein